MTSFKQAQNNPELRQPYIDSVDLGERGQYVSEVTYTGINDIQAFMRCKPNTTKAKSKILVPTNAFIPRITEEDFLSTLLDHEILHAEQYYKGAHHNPFIALLESKLSNLAINFAPSLNIETYEKIMSEREVYKHQLQMIDSGLRKVSKRKKAHIKNLLERNMRMQTPLQALAHIARTAIGDHYHESRAQMLFGKSITELITTPEDTTRTEQVLIKTFIK